MGGTSPSPGRHGQRSDRDLVLDFKGGLDGAYESIYRRHHERVYKTCYRILGNHADAAEATQETFLKAFKALGRFNGQYQLGAWLARIGNNVALDQIRARQRSVNIVAGTDDVVHLEDDRRSLESEVAERIEVRRTLEEIQPLHAEALRLQAVEGLSHKQIAKRLNMSSSQVKSLLHRSRSSFKKLWESASGWAVAPFTFMRFGRSRNSSPGSLASMSPATGVMLERLAASAMAAVVAVAGFASTRGAPDTDRFDGAPDASAPAAVEEIEVGARKVRRADDARAAAAASESLLAKGKAKASELLSIERVLPNELADDGTNGGDDDGLPGSSPAAKEPVPREARKAIRKVEKLVPEPPNPIIEPTGLEATGL